MKNIGLSLISLLIFGSASADESCANTFLLPGDYPFTTPGGVTVTSTANGLIYQNTHSSCGVTSPQGADWLQQDGHWIQYDFSHPVSGPVTFMIVGMDPNEWFTFTTDQGPAVVTSISDPSCIDLTQDNQIESAHSNGGGVFTIEMPANTNWLHIAQTGSQGGALFIMSGCFSTVGEDVTTFAPTTSGPTFAPTPSGPVLKCYYAECGCAPFNADWCSENSFTAGWCSESASNCAQCAGVWSAQCAGDVTPSPTFKPTTSHPTKLPTPEPSFAPTAFCLQSQDDCPATCESKFPDFTITSASDSRKCQCLMEVTIDEMESLIESGQIEIESFEEMPVNIDIQILLDATGSMGAALQAMSASMIAMLDNISVNVKSQTELDAVLRVGVVGYRDPFAGAENEFIAFTEDNAAVDAFLSNLQAMGGGDWPEDVNGGLKIMLDQDWTSEHKFIIHITDAPALGASGPDAAGIMYQDLFAQINEKAITYVVGRMSSSGAVDNMIANFNSVYAVNEQGVTVVDPSEAEIEVLDLVGMNAGALSEIFTTELVSMIVDRVQSRKVKFELAEFPLCNVGPENVVALFEGQYRGEGTYWYPTHGACSMQDTQLAETFTQVGLSHHDFFNGLSCGMCVEITSMEAGCDNHEGCDVIETPVIGVVTNVCDECKTGDINILDLEGRTGRNPTSWRPIPCPGVAAEKLRYNIDQGSNNWYLKMQVRHALRPVKSLSLVGKDGSWIELQNTGFVEPVSPGSFDSNIDDIDALIQRPFAFPLAVRVCDIYDQCVEDTISELTMGIDLVGSQQFPSMRRLLFRND